MEPNDDELLDAERRPRRFRQAVLLGLAAVGLVGLGLLAGMMWGERRAARQTPGVGHGQPSAAVPVQPPATPGGPPAAKSEEPVEVTLAPEAIERAGIKTATVRRGSAAEALSVPGTVASNAYRDTKVNALVGGIVRRVGVELGSAVRRGQSLAVLFSSELAEAQMKYLSMRATVQADEQKRARTERLLGIGAASRQEFEEITAAHAGRATEVAAARQRLLLLGLSENQMAKLQDASDVLAELTVAAPADGIVVARTVNPGQVVMAGQDLFVVTDLSTVWVLGDLYEKDFAAVRVGSSAVVTLPSAPNVALRGRVEYIDPRVDPATRTAKVRVEVPNRGGDLRLGMYATMSFQTGLDERRTLVPRSAVQAIGERSVVYVPVDEAGGRFVERTVKLGQPVGDSVQVVEGLKPGEKVVTEGSFFLRAEAARAK